MPRFPMVQFVTTVLVAMALLWGRFGVAEAAPTEAGPAHAGLAGAPLMKAIVHHEYGASDVLRLEEVEKPVPADDQVLVRVKAASVNPLDWHFMRGSPYIARIDMGWFKPKRVRLGVDWAGQVEAIGKKVTQFKPGDEVFGNRFGAFGEYICAPESSVVSKPANVTFEEAAAVPVAAITALQGLRDEGKVQAGQRVLINGASGGVGTFAVQLAKSMGAEVTGVCSTKNVDMVRSLGADHVIDYTKEDFTKSEQRYDVILDMVGNRSLPEYARALTPQGTLVIVGSTDKGAWLGPVSGMVNALLLSKLTGHHVTAFLADENKDDLTKLRDLMQAGKLRSVIDKRYPLHEVPDAVRYVEEGHARGKVVITVADQSDSPTSTRGAVTASDPFARDILVTLLTMAVLLNVPIGAAVVLNRRFLRKHPGKRPYLWGYAFSLLSVVAGVGLGVSLALGVTVVFACGALYGLLAWFFAQRRRWAWIALTIFSVNPVVWIVNFIYLRRRWSEDAVAPLVAS